MFFQYYYIDNSKNTTISNISSYKNIMDKFVIKFILKKKNNYINNNELYSDALIYSKYYLYWKTFGCVYKDDIMNILFDIEFI